MFARLFDTYSKSGIATLRCARYALTRLSDFGDIHRVSNRSYTYSEGFVAAFLSSQAAPSMPARLLTGLTWAQKHMAAGVAADSEFLAPFKARHNGGSHATTWLPVACCKLAAVASRDPAFSAIWDSPVGSYLASIASGATLMVNASLRWIDAYRATKIVVRDDAVDGFTPKVKAGGPMHWWADRLDVLGNSSWIDPLIESLSGLSSHTFTFRRAEFTDRKSSGNPLAFVRWGKGPAPKAHVVRGIEHILTSSPCPLPADVAKLLARLHGARRVYPTAARFLSGVLKLTVDDRDEMGRWKTSPDAGERSRAGSRPLSNLYGSDAARSRCVATRKLVGDAVRARIAELGWLSVEPDTTWDFLVSLSTSEPSVLAAEPDLDSDETDADKGL